MWMGQRSAHALTAYECFVRTPISSLLAEHAAGDPIPELLALFRRTVESVPAYADFLRARGIDPESVRSFDDFRRLPLATKADYVQRYPLAARCRGGELVALDMIAVSSGSTGEPTIWPRFLSDELAVAARFEQVFHDSFEADRRRTLAIVCFPLGSWVGGMFTASCCRHLATKGYPITVATPGNNKAEILRVVRSLGPSLEQVVLLGYPPFVKEVVDAGLSEGVPWHQYAIKLVLAGEVFSEAWRDLMADRAGMKRPLHDSAAPTAPQMLGYSATRRRSRSRSAAFSRRVPRPRARCSATRGCPRSCSTTPFIASSRSTSARCCSRAKTACRSCAITSPITAVSFPTPP